MNYFKNKKALSILAKEHMEEMARRYANEISDSIDETTIESGLDFDSDDMDKFLKSQIKNEVQFIFAKSTHEKEIFDIFYDHEDSEGEGRICLHNFASYKHPGGMFIQGSSAQEESLCHKSTLYNVIKEFPEYYKWNREHLAGGLYLNRALYSPGIVFDDGNDDVTVDVLTCAAPNRSLLRYGRFDENENLRALELRIAWIHKILVEKNVKTFVTGAFGCGVFCQDASVVARIMAKVFGISNSLMKVFFVIPPGNNYTAFKKCGLYEFYEED